MIGEQCVLAIIPVQPLPDEPVIEIEGRDGSTGGDGRLHLCQLSTQQAQQERPLGEVSQVVHRGDGVH